MTGRVYCTYFDMGYLSRGLALIASLREHGDDATVWILALDDEVGAVIEGLGDPSIRTLAVEQIEAAEPSLLPLKAERSRMEYYFTCTPLLMKWVMQQHATPGDVVIYLDSDLYFFDSPDLVLDALGSGSVGIIQHRYPPRLAQRLAKYGKYNVGWVGIRDDDAGRACAQWWGESTLEWCRDTPQDGKYADQGYLDRFPALFEGVVALQPPGLNLAPWNSAQYELTSDATGAVLVDSSPLVFFHFHGLRRTGEWYVTSQLVYGAPLGRTLRERVYSRYVAALGEQERRVPQAFRPPARRGTGIRGLVYRAARWGTDRLAIITRNALRVSGT